MQPDSMQSEFMQSEFDSASPSDGRKVSEGAITRFIDGVSGPEVELDQLVDMIVKAGKGSRTRAQLDRALDEDDGDVDSLVNAIVTAAEHPTQPPQSQPPQSKPKHPPQQSAARAEVSEYDLDPVEGEDEAIEYAPGQVIGDRYKVVDILGEGGMAVVYRVEHTLLLKQMALKMLRPELSRMPYAVQRFQREARAVCQLDDPHIVRVTDFGRAANGSLYLVMELLPGESLSETLSAGQPLPVATALLIVDAILSGLEHAHFHKVVHRDLKPDNIMIHGLGTQLKVKIVDFGIMKLTADGGYSTKPITKAGVVFGTPKYMSPEQAAGEEVDHRADLYSVGVIFYEMLSGHRPFEGEKATQILSRVLLQPPPPLVLKYLDRATGDALAQVVYRAMEKDPRDRFQSASDFKASLLPFRRLLS